MFAKALLRNQRVFFGRGAVLCLATAVALPVLNKQYKATVCDKIPDQEAKRAAVELVAVDSLSESIPIESPKDENLAVVAQLEVEEDDEDDAAWVAEKQKCSFCKMFILSPCKKQFKNWSNCVDKAKAEEKDFAAVCSDYTKALMACTSDHSEYFQALESASGEEDAHEEEQGETSTDQAGSVAGTPEKQTAPGPILSSDEDEK